MSENKSFSSLGYHLGWWPVFCGLAALVYLPTYQAGYVTDFTGLVPRLEAQGAAGVLTSYGFPALQPLLNLFFYLIYQLDGARGPVWYLAFTLLHGTNAWLLYRCIRSWTVASSGRIRTLAVAAGLFFLLSPYQTEVVVWRVCLNYLLSTATVLSTVYVTLRYLHTGTKHYIRYGWLLTLAGLLCFEQALVIPLLTLGLWLTHPAARQRSLVRATLGQAGLVLVYFLTLRLLLGEWIGHYGASVHVAFPWADMLAAPWQYASKMLLLTRYWPHAWKTAFHAGIALPYISLTLYLALFGWLWYRWQRGRFSAQAVFCVLAFAGCLVPVLNLYFDVLLWVQNDRYGYLAAAFFYPAVLLAVWSLPKVLRWGMIGLFLLLNGWCLARTLSAWQMNSCVYWQLVETYRPTPNTPTYLLNLPDNLCGTPMFRSYHDAGNAFSSALRAFRAAPQQSIHEVMQYNMTDHTDGVRAVLIRPDSLVVEFEQWGNWWWRNGLGAGSYQTEAYRVREQGHRYALILRDTVPRPRLLLQRSEGWQVVGRNDGSSENDR